MERVIGKISSLTQHGTAFYSAAFGCACGTLLFGSIVAGRAFSVLFFDEEYHRINSRQRYLEKRQLHALSSDDYVRSQRMASMVKEYCPVDTRAPFQKVDEKPKSLVAELTQEVNQFVYSNAPASGSRVDRALKRQNETARIAALGGTIPKGVNHNLKHLNQMRKAHARKLEQAKEIEKRGGLSDYRKLLWKDPVQIRNEKRNLARERRDRAASKDISGSAVGTKAHIESIMRKYSKK